MTTNHDDSSDLSERRLKFAIFLKILLSLLRKRKSYLRLEQVRLLITRCIEQNRNGDTHYCPLVDAIEIRLKSLIEEETWNQVESYTELYVQRKYQHKPDDATDQQLYDPLPQTYLWLDEW